MQIIDFTREYVTAAGEIAAQNYAQERCFVAALPEAEVPDAAEFAENGLGVAAIEDGRLVGFLGCFNPWDGAFDSTARGTFSPIHAHGAVSENRAMIYKRLYQAAAEKWVASGITYHAIALYAHDGEAKDALYTYGFGMRCVDAIRTMTALEVRPCEGITFDLLPTESISEIRQLSIGLSRHMGNSPCFMKSDERSRDEWLQRVATRGSEIYVARDGDKPVAYLEIARGGENFATWVDDMRSVCGAFCLPEYRGRGIYQKLLNHTIAELGAKGFKRLGVDYESFNPTAWAFWGKHFMPYTNSVTRRIDECALLNV